MQAPSSWRDNEKQRMRGSQTNAIARKEGEKGRIYELMRLARRIREGLKRKLANRKQDCLAMLESRAKKESQEEAPRKAKQRRKTRRRQVRREQITEVRGEVLGFDEARRRVHKKCSRKRGIDGFTREQKATQGSSKEGRICTRWWSGKRSRLGVVNERKKGELDLHVAQRHRRA